jgi:hypothetical protein
MLPYKLFAKVGVNQIGIDTILAESGCTKASRYSSFKGRTRDRIS